MGRRISGASLTSNGAPHRFLISLLGQKGKRLLSDDNRQAVFDTEDTRKHCSSYDLVYKHKVAPEREGPAGCIPPWSGRDDLDGPWSIAEFRDTEGLDYMTAQCPSSTTGRAHGAVRIRW